LTNNLDEARQVIKLCQDKNIILTVNFQRRHDLFYSYVKENMEQLVGKVKKVICTYAGGVINNGSHAFDLLRYYFGDIISVEASPDDEEDNLELNVVMKFTTGLKVVLTPCQIPNHSSFGLTIYGENAVLNLINKPLFDYSYNYFPHENSSIEPQVTHMSDKQLYPIKKDLERDFFVRAVQNIIECIEKNQIPESSAENGLLALELVCAAIISAREKREISLPYTGSFKLPQIRGLYKQWKKQT